MTTTAFSIYNASAGSGKTYTLVKSYLKILFADPTDDAYKKILAMTFTNKAVHEMKQRVMNTLHDFSQDEVSEKNKGLLEDLALELGLSEKKIQQKSKRIIKNIIHNYAYFGISTLDKFTQKIVRSFATDLGLPVSFETHIDTNELLEEAVDAVVSKAGSDKELTSFLIQFSLEKSFEDKSWDITYLLNDIAKLLTNENDAKDIARYKEVSLDRFVAFKAHLQKNIAAYEDQASATAASLLQLFNDKGFDIASFSGRYFPNYLQKIVDKEFGFAKKYVEPDEIKVNKSAVDREQILKSEPEILEYTQKIFGLLQKKEFYVSFLGNLNALSLIHQIQEELDRIQDEKNIISINRFNAIVSEHIIEQPAPFIYERLGEKYRHFFIDEFQDTSVLQWNNLIPLIDNALAGQDMAGAKGSLLIVGDPKQSIYRFRGGKAEQFIGLSQNDNPFSNPSKETLVLGTNYRSYDQVIQFNNMFFKQIAQEFTHPDYRTIYENESVQKVNAKHGGFVQIEFLDVEQLEEEQTKNELYLATTLKTINSILEQGFHFSEIVLLVQKNKEGSWLANYLTEHQIPILSPDSLLLKNSSEVLVLVDVLKYLINNLDKESKARFLYYLAKNRQSTLETHDFIAQGLSFELETELEQWLQSFGIELHFNEAKKLNLFAGVHYLSQVLFQETKTNSYIQYFLDVAYERSLKNQNSITDFLDFWHLKKNKLSVPAPEHVNAVRIMTIHKSKGLEFPVVIFPFAEKDYSKSKDKLWVNTSDFKDWNMPVALINNNKDVANFDEEISSIYTFKKQEEMLDHINVLYVALTRAEEQLYIITCKKESKNVLSNNMSSYFVKFLRSQNIEVPDQFVYSFGNPQRVSEKSVDAIEDQLKPHPIKTIEDTLSSADIKIAQKQALMWDETQLNAVEYGNLIHELMSKLETKEQVPKLIQKAIWEGLFTQEAAAQIEQKMFEILSHKELQPFFDAEAKIYSEQMILQAHFPNAKPDRLAIKGKLAYILDYKTGKEYEHYKKQVAEYAQILEKMGYQVVQKSLVYIHEDELKVIHL